MLNVGFHPLKNGEARLMEGSKVEVRAKKGQVESQLQAQLKMQRCQGRARPLTVCVKNSQWARPGEVEMPGGGAQSISQVLGETLPEPWELCVTVTTALFTSHTWSDSCNRKYTTVKWVQVAPPTRLFLPLSVTLKFSLCFTHFFIGVLSFLPLYSLTAHYYFLI